MAIIKQVVGESKGWARIPGGRKRTRVAGLQCPVCFHVCNAGEEAVLIGQGVSGRLIHRSCLEDWLDSHPKVGGKSKLSSVDEEFEALRTRLIAEADMYL